jgi:hypothetical protein
MSDCFNHELDAYESYENYNDDDGPNQDWQYRKRNRLSTGSCIKFKPNPLFYFNKVPFLSVYDASDKAIQFKFTNEITFWVPRKLCKELDEGHRTVYIHTEFFKTKIKDMRSAEIN